MTDAIGSTPVYRPDLIADLYRPMRHGDWKLHRGGTVLTRGYWSPPQLVPDIVTLLRGSETWMSITPMEIESQEIGVAHAHGHVVIFGLGLGWSTAASALRSDVEHVTVVERDPDVIVLHAALDLFAALPDGVGSKVRVVAGDAYTWRPDEPVDLLMADIWLPLVSGDRVGEVRRMHDNVGASALYFWGQEMEIARHAQAGGRTIDAAGITATVASFGLPLVGPGDPAYATRVAAVADAWMRDRWFPT